MIKNEVWKVFMTQILKIQIREINQIDRSRIQTQPRMKVRKITVNLLKLLLP